MNITTTSHNGQQRYLLLYPNPCTLNLMSSPHLAETKPLWAFSHGPPRVRRLGRIGRSMANATIAINLSGTDFEHSCLALNP